MSVPSLRRYLEIKAHHLLCERDWASIRVIGAYDRDCVASANEKNDKLFNWQRPTAQVHGDTLVVLGWGLGHFTDPGAWTAGYGYAWQRAEHHGRRVLYLGYRHSIWGDV